MDLIPADDYELAQKRYEYINPAFRREIDSAAEELKRKDSAQPPARATSSSRRSSSSRPS